MSYEINWEENGVVVRFWGTYTFEVNNDADLEVYSAPQLEGLKYVIWDLTDISEMSMTEDEAVLPATHNKLASSRLLHVKVAMIATDQQTRRVCEAYVAGCRNRGVGWDFMVSDSMETIRKWIAD
jgi:hypothetical protein